MKLLLINPTASYWRVTAERPPRLATKVPAVLLTIAASSAKADAGAVFGVSILPGVLTWIAFKGSTPSKPQINGPLVPEKLDSLRKYCRFPAGLSESQLREFIAAHKEL